MKLRLALTGGISLSIIAYLGLVLVDRSDHTLRERLIDRTIILYLLAFVGFGLVAWRNEVRPLDKRWLWLIPIGFRIVLAFTTPTLSDDVYRYQWDGHLVAEGVNPYAHPILAPELDGYETDARLLANNPTLSSPYLPIAHLVFAATDTLLPESPHSFQLVMILFDLAIALGLVRLLRTTGLGEHRVLLYLWNPFVIVEIAHGAHLDAIMVALAVWALVLTLGQRPASTLAITGAPVLLALATLTRPLPALLLPVLWWRWSWAQRILYAVVGFAVVAPFSFGPGWGLFGDPTGTGVFGSARAYANTFRFNSGVFHWIDQLGVDERVARQIVAAALVIVLLAVWRKARSATSSRALLRLAIVPVAAYVVLTPVLHPWYALLGAALLVFVPPATGESARRWALLAAPMYLFATFIFSYLTYRDPLNYGEVEWVRVLEWVPVAVLAALSLTVARSSSRPSTPVEDPTSHREGATVRL